MVSDGSQTRFWEDLWIGKVPLMVKYPTLYNLVRKKNMTVAQILSTTPLNVSFRRALEGVNWDNRICIVRSVIAVTLSEHMDSFKWTANKIFSVKNLYNDLVLRSGTPVNCWAWNAKIPLKIKIFLWFLKNRVLLTKDNLVKRQWKGCTKVLFLYCTRVNKHLFFDCIMARLMWGIICSTFGTKKPLDVGHLFSPWLRSFSKKQRNHVLVGVTAFCWTLWISRNDLVFHKSQYKSVLQVMFRGTYWIRSWAILSKEGRIILLEGCRILETMAMEIFHKSEWNALRRIDA
jgi:hypothetical protein